MSIIKRELSISIRIQFIPEKALKVPLIENFVVLQQKVKKSCKLEMNERKGESLMIRKEFCFSSFLFSLSNE